MHLLQEYIKKGIVSTIALLLPLISFAEGEYSCRAADMYDPDDFEPLSEMIATYPDKLKLLPIALIALIVAFVFCHSRGSTKPDDLPWFFISQDDKTWHKLLLLVCWIAFLIGIVPTIYASLQIIDRVVLKSILTIIVWLIKILISIIILAIFVFSLPVIGICSFDNINTKFGCVVGLISFVMSIIIVIYFWTDIISWPFMFPPLEFNF